MEKVIVLFLNSILQKQNYHNSFVLNCNFFLDERYVVVKGMVVSRIYDTTNLTKIRIHLRDIQPLIQVEEVEDTLAPNFIFTNLKQLPDFQNIVESISDFSDFFNGVF